MREIKFRAWDGKKKVMWESDFHIGNTGILYFWDDENNGYVDKQLPYADLVLMQYTGLKDKNGKEIYEGDVILLWENDKEGVVVLWDQEIGGFGFKGQDMATHLNFRKLSTRNYVVIGNVHENPELLPDTKE